MRIDGCRLKPGYGDENLKIVYDAKDRQLELVEIVQRQLSTLRCDKKHVDSQYISRKGQTNLFSQVVLQICSSP